MSIIWLKFTELLTQYITRYVKLILELVHTRRNRGGGTGPQLSAYRGLAALAPQLCDCDLMFHFLESFRRSLLLEARFSGGEGRGGEGGPLTEDTFRRL